MPIQGARIVPRLDLSTATAAASLTIRKPDGTSVPGTGEAGSSGNTVWTADEVELDQPDVWVFHWDTDEGDAEEYVLVSPAGTALALPAPLATIAHLVARLGRQLTAAELARAPGLLAAASAKIRSYTRQTFTPVEDDVVKLRPTGAFLRLRQRPVNDVSQVEQIGTAGTVDRVMSPGEWAWDGIDLIELWPDPCVVDGIMPTGQYADAYRVTYGHGSDIIPDDVVDVCVDMTLRTLTSPAQAAGLVSESIGEYSYQLQQGSGAPGPTVQMADADRATLKHYRPTAGTIALRAR